MPRAPQPTAVHDSTATYYTRYAHLPPRIPTLPSPLHPQICEAVELLRLAAFFGNAPLVAALAAHLAAQLSAMPEAELLEVGRGGGGWGWGG